MFFKYKNQIKYVLFSLFLLAIGGIFLKPSTNAYAVTHSNNRQEHISMYAHYHDGYSISIDDGEVVGGGDDARYGVDADNYWMDGFSASVWGDYIGSLSYSAHCHVFAWTANYSNGEYLNGPAYFGSISSDWRTHYAWIEALTIELSGDINNFYYMNYEAYPVMATYDYVNATTYPPGGEPFPIATWRNGYRNNKLWIKPGQEWYESSANMTNWNGQNWVGTTGAIQPLCGVRGKLTKRPATVTINPNGGTLDGSTSTQTFDCKADETFVISNPTRANYTFKGWKVEYTYQEVNEENGFQSVSNNYAPRNGGINGSDIGAGTTTSGGFSSSSLWIGNCRTVTLTAQWELNSYPQIVYVRYQNADGSWDSYSPVINTNYNYGSTVSWSRAADSVYKAASISYMVTGANTKYVSVYRNGYTQTINYYTYDASGVYNSATHNFRYLGSKPWSLLYGSTFNAYSHRAEWGNIAGYHYWNINDNSWTVTGKRETNSHYYPNTYRLNVDLNKGGGSSTPSGTSGDFDMEYGTYINLGTPTMTGYTFGGWSITEHNSTDHSLSANTFTMGYNKSYPNQSYTSDSTVKIKAKWNVNSYNLIYDLNDSTGSTSAQFGAYHPNTVKFDTEFTVSNPSRAGYSFAGWNITGMDNSTHYYGAHRTTEGYIDNTCETVFKNLNSLNEAVVTFKAVWLPNTYTIHFEGNGAAGGNVDDITVSYDENMTLPENGYELDRNTFVGWTHDCTAHVGTYAEGQEILSSVIIDAAGMTIQNNGIIYLYCAWDPAPNITVSDKTFSLDEARNGLITEGRLFEGAYAMDEILDSDILPGTHLLENGSCNSFTITNFSEDEFTQFTDSGSATITYQVVDSVGNITEETITVFIVDNTPKEAQSGEGTYHVRFISDKYYDKTEVEGGLPEDSIWRKRPEYVELLNEIMGKY